MDADFDFEPRGEVEIKGLGARETWYLVGEKRQPGSAGHDADVSETLAKRR
jgi:hypothetical protein